MCIRMSSLLLAMVFSTTEANVRLKMNEMSIMRFGIVSFLGYSSERSLIRSKQLIVSDSNFLNFDLVWIQTSAPRAWALTLMYIFQRHGANTQRL